MEPVPSARPRQIYPSSSAPSRPIHQRRGEFIALLIDYLNSGSRERRVQLSHWSDRLSRWTSRPLIGQILTGTTTKGARPLINSSVGLVISRLFQYFQNDVCPMTVTKWSLNSWKGSLVRLSRHNKIEYGETLTIFLVRL